MQITAKKILVSTCATACAALSGPANATVLYNTAGSYSITTTLNDNIHIDNTLTTVSVDLAGMVLGVDTLTPAYREAAARVQRGRLDVTGNARIIAGLNQSAIEMTSSATSEVHIGGRAAIHGNIKSDFAPIWGDEATATQRLYIEGNGLVSGNLLVGGYLRVQDSAVVSGEIRGAMNANLRVDITGGFVSGPLVLGGLDNHIFNMSAGTLSGGFNAPPSYVQMDVRGGYIRQGLRSTGTINGLIRGGYIDGGVAIANNVGGGSNLSVRGGRIETVPADYLFAVTETYTDAIPSTLKICGGQFGYSQEGTGLRIDGNTNLVVYGSGLAFAAGRLTGTLQDGNPIDVPLSFGPTWSGSFTITPVAVPTRPTC